MVAWVEPEDSSFNPLHSQGEGGLGGSPQMIYEHSGSRGGQLFSAEAEHHVHEAIAKAWLSCDQASCFSRNSSTSSALSR